MKTVKDKIDELNAEILATREWMCDIIGREWYEQIKEKLKK